MGLAVLATNTLILEIVELQKHTKNTTICFLEFVCMHVCMYTCMCAYIRVLFSSKILAKLTEYFNPLIDVYLKPGIISIEEC